MGLLDRLRRSRVREAAGLSWSEVPGAFEQQLRRRHECLLFPPSRRRISPDELVRARTRDEEDLASLNTATRALAREMAAQPASVEFAAWDAVRERVEDLIQEASGIGTLADHTRDQLFKLRGALYSDARSGFLSNPDLLAKLDGLDVFWQREGAQFRHHLVAAILRGEEGPIALAELLPSVLAADVAGIRHVMGWADPELARKFRRRGLELLRAAQAEGLSPADAEAKAAALRGDATSNG